MLSKSWGKTGTGHVLSRRLLGIAKANEKKMGESFKIARRKEEL